MASVEKRIRDGKVTWLARWRDPDGLQRKKSFPRRVDADRFLTALSADMARGTYIDPDAGKILVKEWADQWLAAQSHLKATTRERYAGVLRNHVVPRWGQRSLASVAHAELAGWFGQLASSGLAPGSVRYIHAAMLSMFGLAVRDARIARNPASGIRLPRQKRREPRFLSPTEVTRLAEAAGVHGDVIRVLAMTGLRFGELAALRVRRVDLLRGRIMIAESVTEVSGRMIWSTPKNHSSRSVPVARSLVEVFARACAAKGPEELVFTSPEGGPLRINNWRPRVFDPACRKAGLVGASPHDLRHTAASLAVSAGANVKAVQRMLGHASAAMTLDVYAGLFSDDLDDVAQRLDALVPPACPRDDQEEDGVPLTGL